MSVVCLGIEVIGIGTIIFALMLLLRGDGSREQKLMQYFLIGSLVQNVGYLLELTARTPEAALVAKYEKQSAKFRQIYPALKTLFHNG